MKKSLVPAAALMAAVLVCVVPKVSIGRSVDAQPSPLAPVPPVLLEASELIGSRQSHTIAQNETLLDIARRFRLGFNEIQALYPHLDPWLPPLGMPLLIPSQWILPLHLNKGILINIAELRLYVFNRSGTCIRSFPVSIGENHWPTPEGEYAVSEKMRDPAWNVPPSLKSKYGFTRMPPGPDNPLGRYWLGLGNTHYGIHGTDFPWSIGRAVTRGCIRLYPEDMKQLFDLVQPGMKVKIIYAPVKLCRFDGRVFVEVHNDVYDRFSDFEQYGFYELQKQKLGRLVDGGKFLRALNVRSGIPEDVTHNAIDPGGADIQ